MKETLSRIDDFLTENELHINVGKITLLECMIPQKKGRTKGQPPELTVEEEPGKQKLKKDTGQFT